MMSADFIVLVLHMRRYYERAPEYGNKTNKQGGSETVIGRALAAAPSLKEKAFVTTKCTLQPYTEEKIRDACAYSSKKLQTDCIELYQLHGWDPKTPIADQLGVLAALQKEGKIKYGPLLKTALLMDS